jgi:hypothetical protein
MCYLSCLYATRGTRHCSLCLPERNKVPDGISLARLFFERVIRREKKGRPEKAAGIDETLVPLSSVLHLASLGQ